MQVNTNLHTRYNKLNATTSFLKGQHNVQMDMKTLLVTCIASERFSLANSKAKSLRQGLQRTYDESTTADNHYVLVYLT